MAVQYLPRPGIPAPILKALKDQSDYNNGVEDHFGQIPEEIRGQFTTAFSVTTLPRAVRQRVLFARHSHRVWVDPISEIYKLNGKVVHSILEKYAEPGDIVETRLGTLVDLGPLGNVWIHGQCDRYVPSERLLQDYKHTSVWSVIRGVSEGYVAQLNVLRWLWSLQGGDPIEKMEDVFIFKDWRASDVDRIANYPKEPIMMVEAPMWPLPVVLDYVKGRATAHLEADKTEDSSLTECSDSERWMEAPIYKVFKIDPKSGEIQKVAKHNSPTSSEAEAWISEHLTDAKGNDIQYKIVERKGQPKFCAYCEVSGFCDQFQREHSQSVIEEQNEPTE